MFQFKAQFIKKLINIFCVYFEFRPPLTSVINLFSSIPFLVSTFKHITFKERWDAFISIKVNIFELKMHRDGI